MAWIEQRGRQHRVYWLHPDGSGRDFEPFEDKVRPTDPVSAAEGSTP